MPPPDETDVSDEAEAAESARGLPTKTRPDISKVSPFSSMPSCGLLQQNIEYRANIFSWQNALVAESPLPKSVAVACASVQGGWLHCSLGKHVHNQQAAKMHVKGVVGVHPSLPIMLSGPAMPSVHCNNCA